MANIFCFIPCNLDSRRLPHKPLLEKNGKTILEHTYELASQIRCLTRPPIYLYDDKKFNDWAILKNNLCSITGIETPRLDNGTLRCAWAAENFYAGNSLDDDDIIINVQVDEVEFYPEAVSEAIRLFIYNNDDIGTFCYQKEDHIEYNRNHVKASLTSDGSIIYFSREDISEIIHTGIYIYRVSCLKAYKEMYRYTKAVIKRENLEQMLFYELGTVFTAYSIPPTFSINTEDDYNEWLRR